MEMVGGVRCRLVVAQERIKVESHGLIPKFGQGELPTHRRLVANCLPPAPPSINNQNMQMPIRRKRTLVWLSTGHGRGVSCRATLHTIKQIADRVLARSI